MHSHLLKALRNVLVLTTVLPPFWFTLAALTVLSGVRVGWPIHPWLFGVVFFAFWATPLLLVAGLVLGVGSKVRKSPLPNYFFTVLFLCAALWLGMVGLGRVLPS